MNKNYLLTPGPTPLPPKVREALSREIIHHRTPQFQNYLKDAEEGLQYIFATKNDVFILSSSGTGAMEAAVANLVSPGDSAICVQGGKFGERWTELVGAYAAKPIVIDVEWGEAIDPKVIEQTLEKNKNIKAVFTTLCETSTAVSTDIKTIGDIVAKTPAVLVVDAISALGAVNLETDNWQVDVVVAGSQKGLMLPPGLGFLSVSPKADKLIQNSKSPRYYFDLRLAKKSLDKTDTPFTPAITLVIALCESLKMIKQEGLSNMLGRFNKLAAATRRAMQAMGLEIFTKSDAISDAVTAVKVPQGLDGAKLVKTMRDQHGVTIAGGQSQLKGKIFRIAHMGFITENDLKLAITTLEDVLSKMGYKLEKGAGVKAFEEELKNK